MSRRRTILVLAALLAVAAPSAARPAVAATPLPTASVPTASLPTASVPTPSAAATLPATASPASTATAAPSPAVPPLAPAAAADGLAALAAVAVQDNGRLKPLDSFAREQVFLITGRARWEREAPLYTLLHLLALPETWDTRVCLPVGSPELARGLGLLDAAGRPLARVALAQLDRDEVRVAEQELALLAKEHPRDARLKRLAHASDELGRRAYRLASLEWNAAPRLFPPPAPAGAPAVWLALADLDDPAAASPPPPAAAAYQALLDAFRAGKAEAFRAAAGRLAEALAPAARAAGADETRLAAEVRYNRLAPFTRAWQLYFVVFLLYLAALLRSGRRLERAALIGLGLAGLWLSAAVAWRTWLAGRLPLTNGYESLVAMGWALGLGTLLAEARSRRRVAGAAGALLTFILLALTENLPAVFSPEIEPLRAILQSAWLRYHVCTVMLAYGAFALAGGLGLFRLAAGWLGRPAADAHPAAPPPLPAPAEPTAPEPSAAPEVPAAAPVVPAAGGRGSAELELLLYRVLLVGFVCLTVGIITGAVWGHYAWGRYWGWDAKETWSLVTWLYYAVALHLRLRLPRREALTAALALGGLGCVLFTYFGVNYWLPSLHSYA